MGRVILLAGVHVGATGLGVVPVSHTVRSKVSTYNLRWLGPNRPKRKGALRVLAQKRDARTRGLVATGRIFVDLSPTL